MAGHNLSLTQRNVILSTQKAMGQPFDVRVTAISNHLKNIFETRELAADSVISKMETTTTLGY